MDKNDKRISNMFVAPFRLTSEEATAQTKYSHAWQEAYKENLEPALKLGLFAPKDTEIGND